MRSPARTDHPPSAPGGHGAEDEESAPLILSADGGFPPAPAATATPPPSPSPRRTRSHHHMASRLVQVSAVIFVLSTVASVGHFAPGSATRLVLGARMPDFSGVDGSYGTVLRGEDVAEPEGPRFGVDDDGACSDVLLLLPGAGNAAGGPPDLASQLGAYVVASLAAAYTDMALVLLEDESDSTSVGCPDDTVEEHGSSFHFDGHYKIFPRGLSTLVRHPAWLSRGCGPPCPGSHGYGDWLGRARSAAGGGQGGADIPGAASVLCEESTSNVLVVTSESVFAYFHQLRSEMVDRTTGESIRRAHGWALNLGAADDEAAVMSTLRGEDDIMDYAEALAARTGIPMLQPWISRDVQSFVAENKMENWMSGSYPAIYKPEYHVPFADYLVRFSEVQCGTHHTFVATHYPFAVQDEVQSLPSIRGGRRTVPVKRMKRCLGFTFRVGPSPDDGGWVRNPTCRNRYDKTVATVAELMVLARASILVGDLSTNTGRLARFFRSSPTESTSVIHGEGGPISSRATVVMGDDSASRHVYQPPASADGLTVHFYIKTSGSQVYLDRARHSADTWTRDADPGSVTFLFDNHQADEVDRMAEEHPWIAIRHVEGTDQQGNYKGHRKPEVEAAHAAQHLKTRAVFDLYRTDPVPDWVCYLDDDMMVNVAVLKEDLLELTPNCSPDCLIADGQVWMPNGENGKGSGMIQPYTVGGYCMQDNLVRRVTELFAAKTDADIGWIGTDDLHFNRFVMQEALGVTVTNSDRWYSEFAYPDVDEYGFHKHTMHQDRANGAVGMKFWMRQKPTWEKDGELMAKFVPSLAVYHMGYDKK